MSSTAALWMSIGGGLLIVLAAVGIPYWLTHRHMRQPRDAGSPARLSAFGTPMTRHGRNATVR